MIENFMLYLLFICVIFYIIRMGRIFYYYKNKGVIVPDVGISVIIISIAAYAIPMKCFSVEIYAGREHVLYGIYALGLILASLFSEALTYEAIRLAKKTSLYNIRNYANISKKMKIDNSPELLVMSFSSLIGSMTILVGILLSFFGTTATYEYVAGEKIEHLFSWSKTDYSHPASEKVESIFSTQKCTPGTGAKVYNFLKDDGSKYSLYCLGDECSKEIRKFSRVLDNGDAEFTYVNGKEKVVWVEPKDLKRNITVRFYTNDELYEEEEFVSVFNVETKLEPRRIILHGADEYQEITLTCRDYSCKKETKFIKRDANNG